jgi:membrane protein
MARRHERRAALRELKHYFGRTIWRPVPAGATTVQRAVRRSCRFLYLIARGFRDDRVLVRAPALTLTTLLALVPLLALVLSVASGFDLQRPALDHLRKLLTDFVAVGQQDVVETVITYVEKTRLGTLGGVGLAILLWAAINLLSTIEGSFNDIWAVTKRRPLHRRVVDYLGVVVVFPVLLFASTGLTATASASSIVERLQQAPLLSGALETGAQLLPILIVGAAFTFLYAYLPYTSVRFHAALVAGFGTGLVWHLAQWAFISFQVGVTRGNVIYGTFAALPIFLVWLNVNWIVVLAGCEVAYAVQHEATYHPPVPHSAVSIARRERAALEFVSMIWKRFREGLAPLSSSDLAAEVDLPRPVLRDVLTTLVDCGLLARTAEPDEALLPARDLGAISVGEILLTYRHAGTFEPAESTTPQDERVDRVHERLEDALRSAGDQTLGAVSA